MVLFFDFWTSHSSVVVVLVVGFVVALAAKTTGRTPVAIAAVELISCLARFVPFRFLIAAS